MKTQKKLYNVVLYYESYQTIQVEAKNEAEASDIVMSGNYDDSNILDTEIKDSDIISTKEATT